MGYPLFIYCKDKIPIVAKKIPQAPGGEFWLTPHERILHSVALSFEDQQVAVVYQTIDQSRGHGLIEEDIHPPAELQVGGDDHHQHQLQETAKHIAANRIICDQSDSFAIRLAKYLLRGHNPLLYYRKVLLESGYYL